MTFHSFFPARMENQDIFSQRPQPRAIILYLGRVGGAVGEKAERTALSALAGGHSARGGFLEQDIHLHRRLGSWPELAGRNRAAQQHRLAGLLRAHRESDVL